MREQTRLTRTEAAVVRVLRDTKRMMTSEDIYRHVWLYLGYPRTAELRAWVRSLKWHVMHIRKKLGRDVIVTGPGGYMLGEHYERHCESCGHELGPGRLGYGGSRMTGQPAGLSADT